MSATLNLIGAIESSIAMSTRNLKRYEAARWALVPLRERYGGSTGPLCDTPDAVAKYWAENIESDPSIALETETAVVLMVNTRRKVVGHVVVATGTIDALMVHPREVFRAAIIGNASAIIFVHNHPSGDSTPSEADMRVTRELLQAGKILKIELLDSVIVGKTRTSLRELGYFAI